MIDWISEYGPVAWGAVVLVSALLIAMTFALMAWYKRTQVRTLYDAKLLESGLFINPLDNVFERKRIFINDFVLPSHRIIQNKTFIDCDLIGPGTIYFRTMNQVQPIREPRVDIVWLSPTAVFYNGFIFDNCIFRNCSFQRITIFASLEDFDNWKTLPMLNPISIEPSQVCAC